MALWKETNSTSAGAVPAVEPPVTRDPPVRAVDTSPAAAASAAAGLPKSSPRIDLKESVISADLAIEGKIVGAGHVRIAGRFKGDVQVEGNLTIDSGAKLEGQVRASAVMVAGELLGNIENAKRVELLSGGVIIGDVKAGSLTVAAGSRMRGQSEFGWDDEAKTGFAAQNKGIGQRP
jgi:cytoskeletal protein CcmA (bactofilin family)